MLYVELAIVVALILVNGLLAMAELAIVSSRRTRLQQLASQGVSGSRLALALAADPGKFLSSVQIGITLVGVLSGAFSGATLGVRLGEWLEGFGLSENVADAVSVALVVTAITYASLIVGELVPKQIALRNPERVAVRVAPAMTLLARAASPIVWLLDVSGRFVLRILGQGGRREDTVTEEEIRTLVTEAETAGVIETGERDMITSVLRFGERGVRGLMTPRHEVDMVDLTADARDIRRVIFESVHSRLPAHEGSPDAIIGILQAKDLLDAYLTSGEPDVRKLVRPAANLPDTADALAVVVAIKNSAVHMALVHDEYGDFEGIVTSADILEAIVGEFRTDEGPAEPHAVMRNDGSWLIAGAMPADEMAEKLGIALPGQRAYQTAAGFVLDEFGNLPQTGDVFEAAGYRFEIVDLDGRRIDKILAKRVPARRRA